MDQINKINGHYDECYLGEKMTKEETPRSIATAIAITICQEIKNMGKIEMIVSELIQDDCFGDLSKHNPAWQSEHSREDDLLHAIRYKLMHIQDKLAEIALLAENDHEWLGS